MAGVRRRDHRGVLLCVAALTLALAASAVPPGVATAADEPGDRVLEGVLTVDDLVVDASHGWAFVLGSGRVVALSGDGGVVGDVPVAGASAIAVGGEHLYVATAAGIAQVELATLGVVRTLPVDGAPTGLAVAAGLVWYSHPSGLSSIDPATGARSSIGVAAGARLTSLPGQPWSFLSWTGRDLAVHDGTSGGPVVLAEVPGVVDAAVTDDGGSVVVVTTTGTGGMELSLDELAPAGPGYPAGPAPVAVDTSAEGGGLVAVASADAGSAEVAVFRRGQPGAVSLIDLPGPVLPRGLALGGDGRTVLAVTAGPTGAVVHVRAVDGGPVDVSAAQPAPGLGVAPASLTFPATPIGGTSVTSGVVLTNTGSATLTFGSPFDASGFDLDRRDFAVAWTSCSTAERGLEPGQSCEVAFVFTPTEPGSRHAEHVVYSDAVGSPHRIGLSGVAVPALAPAQAGGAVSAHPAGCS